MLSRYTMYRRRPKNAGPLPEGVRKDTRYGTKHVLRPTKEIVEAYLSEPSDSAWREFRTAYLAVLQERFNADNSSFDELVALATENDVYLGCNCPTKKNPIVGRCHTYLALEFMQKKFPKLKIVVPE
jgi:uncharacterized protein YeaO (DUF488 family)